MDKKLKMLFELQRFENNPRLQSLIETTQERSKREMADDDLWMVNAAGAPDLQKPEPKKQDEEIR